MSENWISFIPTKPTFQPSLQDAENAERLLVGFLPGAERIEFSFTEHVGFVHPGGNWSGVKCPACGADLDNWWSKAMESAYASRFADLEATTPCCTKRVSLNDLHYIWPAGFSKFVLTAMNPRANDITPEQMREVEVCLGCALRRIWVHL